jgi:hypothetical protein
MGFIMRHGAMEGEGFCCVLTCLVMSQAEFRCSERCLSRGHLDLQPTCSPNFNLP